MSSAAEVFGRERQSKATRSAGGPRQVQTSQELERAAPPGMVPPRRQTYAGGRSAADR